MDCADYLNCWKKTYFNVSAEFIDIFRHQFNLVDDDNFVYIEIEFQVRAHHRQNIMQKRINFIRFYFGVILCWARWLYQPWWFRRWLQRFETILHLIWWPKSNGLFHFILRKFFVHNDACCFQSQNKWFFEQNPIWNGQLLEIFHCDCIISIKHLWSGFGKNHYSWALLSGRISDYRLHGRSQPRD